jgi:SAM-dependent methyltransferase
MPLPPAMPDSPAEIIPPGASWEFEEVACDFCGDSRADVLITGRDRLHGLPGTFRVVSCRACGLARTSPRPTLASLGTAYPSKYGPHKHGGKLRPPLGLLRWALVNLRGYPLGRRASWAARMLLWPLARQSLRTKRGLGYLPWATDGRLLDFGCGSGTYLARVAAAGWRAEGVDLSENALSLARAAGLAVHLGTLPGLALPEESYDAITMRHALEHVPSPSATLEAAYKLLRPGGRLLVAVPRFDSIQARRFGSAWMHLDLPRHLTHFTKATLSRHLAKAGFEIEAVHAINSDKTIRRSFGFLATDSGKARHRWLAKSKIAGWAMSLACLLAGGRTDEMLCMARKPGL